MLESLCTLITALTCVSAVTVLTQKPTVVSLSRGESVTMDCNLGTVTDSSARGINSSRRSSSVCTELA
ncbi:hypothetical protein D4764_0155160 [Takifugu flavidus]|uniref:Uncharacterized protein n=1 Tax=Takifugu flavidus TaxID=433684 RepID=A0A5C6MCG1_9TELE|nr:hypothetical protein D4764_0155160 [Takifugu flavidus]